MYQLLKPLLFQIAPEKAHHLTVKLFKIVLNIPIINTLFKQNYRYEHPTLEKQLFGLNFKNPVGLAAGFDKDGKYFREMAALGFGFIEVGTVTPKGQVGNPQPRLFRLPEDEALINRMGFNNDGVEALIKQLKKGKPKGVIIGGNIGKNKVTPNEQAVEDYKITFEALFPYVDYFVVNVSSPNTPNLRDLQEKEPLTKLLSTLQDLNQAKIQPKPLLLKIAPDLTFSQIDDVIEIAGEVKLDGLIATNTTIDRSNLAATDTQIESIGAGGLSGAPLRKRATEVIRYIHEKTNGALPIVGVGGINSAEDALEKIQAGASLVQIYTGLIYQGPTLIKKINKLLAKIENK
ncbi:MAG: quinone-dependent dihydroorotate dehydrogenase [Bacteroidota bacterium]